MLNSKAGRFAFNFRLVRSNLKVKAPTGEENPNRRGKLPVSDNNVHSVENFTIATNEDHGSMCPQPFRSQCNNVSSRDLPPGVPSQVRALCGSMFNPTNGPEEKVKPGCNGLIFRLLLRATNSVAASFLI